MATYAIGDIQGCYQSLLKLLNKIKFDAQSDSLWLVGDLINRGPQSLETLRFIYEHQDKVKCVLGNHDLHFLAVHAGVRPPTKKDTLDELLNAPDCDKLVDWLKQQPLCYRDKNLKIAMSHAGIPPQWSVKKAVKYSKEVSDCLQSEKAVEFFQEMYGNFPAKWNKELEGNIRLRVITNYLTRMRFCFADGALELTYKTPIGQQPSSLFPWFRVKRKKKLKYDLLFGHWAALEGKCDDDKIYALDTGCCWKGKLTALRLEDKAKFSVKSVD